MWGGRGDATICTVWYVWNGAGYIYEVDFSVIRRDTLGCGNKSGFPYKECHAVCLYVHVNGVCGIRV